MMFVDDVEIYQHFSIQDINFGLELEQIARLKTRNTKVIIQSLTQFLEMQQDLQQYLPFLQVDMNIPYSHTLQ